jgi:hypothetical protein
MEIKYYITVETTDECNMDSEDIREQILEEMLSIFRFYNVKLIDLEIK